MADKKTWLQSYAVAHQAAINCESSGNAAWLEKHKATLKKLEDLLPYGSGFDEGTRVIDVRTSGNQMIGFQVAYHHMNDTGHYTGWTNHKVYVRPRLDGGMDIHVSGLNKNDIKEYIGQCFYDVMTSEVAV